MMPKICEKWTIKSRACVHLKKQRGKDTGERLRGRDRGVSQRERDRGKRQGGRDRGEET